MTGHYEAHISNWSGKSKALRFLTVLSDSRNKMRRKAVLWVGNGYPQWPGEYPTPWKSIHALKGSEVEPADEEKHEMIMEKTKNLNIISRLRGKPTSVFKNDVCPRRANSPARTKGGGQAPDKHTSSPEPTGMTLTLDVRPSRRDRKEAARRSRSVSPSEFSWNVGVQGTDRQRKQLKISQFSDWPRGRLPAKSDHCP